MTLVCKIENFKQARDEVNLLSSYKCQEVSFRRHDPQVKLKKHLQQVGFQWRYSQEELLPGELSQQHILVKSRIANPDQMFQMDKEVELKRAIEVKNKASSERINIVRIEDEESSSSSSMSLYNIKSYRKYSEVSSRQSATLVETQVLDKPEEVHSSPTMNKNQSERHSQVHQEE
jgi:hypothetical protein